MDKRAEPYGMGHLVSGQVNSPGNLSISVQVTFFCCKTGHTPRPITINDIENVIKTKSTRSMRLLRLHHTNQLHCQCRTASQILACNRCEAPSLNTMDKRALTAFEESYCGAATDAKVKQIWECEECGERSPQWTGKCKSCEAWNRCYVARSAVQHLVKIGAYLPKKNQSQRLPVLHMPETLFFPHAR